jgi:hypothetical protein
MTALQTIPVPSTVRGESSAWRGYADVLAHWATPRLVNRTDVWGGYLPLRYRTPGGSKSVTRPSIALRGRRTLTHEILAAHFRGYNHGHVIGTHSTSRPNTSRWGLVDLDAHGQRSDRAANESAAMTWYERLVQGGFNPLLTTSDDRGGLHLRVLFDRPMPTPRVYAFMRDLVSDHDDHGVAEVEIFPKQPRVRPDGFGNWARMPGLHHSRPVWTKVWDGNRWTAGEQAVQVILARQGDPADLIPPDVVAPPPPQSAGLVITNLPDPTLQANHPVAQERMSDTQVALACLAAIDNGGEGVHYNTWIAVGMALHSVDSGSSMLDAWVAWSRQSGKHVEGVCQTKWSSFGRRSGWTLGSLVKWARDAGTDVFAGAGNGGRTS